MWCLIFWLINLALNGEYEEIVTCNKQLDICIYTANTYKNKAFKLKDNFLMSPIEQIEANAYETTRRGRKGRIERIHHYDLNLHLISGDTKSFPIRSSDLTELENRYYKFLTFLENDNQTFYSDYKKNDTIKWIMILLGVAMFLTLIFLYTDRKEEI